MAKLKNPLLAIFALAICIGALFTSCAGTSIASSSSPEPISKSAADTSLSPTATDPVSDGEPSASPTSEPHDASELSDAFDSTASQASPASPSSEEDTAALDSETAYLDVRETFGIISSDNREDYDSDAAFANYRMLSGGKLKKATVYRSASPIDNIYGRVPYVERLIENDGIGFILDLADSDDEIWALTASNAEAGADDSYFMGLYNAGDVACLGLTTDYEQDWFGPSLAAGLSELAEHDGPYLLHCMVGKDRTGFACALIEALAGATYDEMEKDYMITYENYYGISKDTSPEEYEAIRTRNFDPMLRFVAGVSGNTKLQDVDYSMAARAYLQESGLSNDQIDKLITRICE